MRVIRIIFRSLALGLAAILAAGAAPARAGWLQDSDIATLPLFLLGLYVTLMIFRLQTMLRRRKE
jgi:hypothetical protein